MANRLVIVRIDDIMALLKDYLGQEDFPPDTSALSLRVVGGKIQILCESDGWRETDLEPRLQPVRFDIQRSYLVG